MTMMNGAKHDVEDILASIRTSIADRSPFDGDRRDNQVTTLRGRSVIADEALDFELPAIFKATSAPIPERPNLLGRLSEALSSSSSTNTDRSRTVIPFEPAHGRMLEPPPVMLEAVAKDAPAKTAEKIAAENDSMKRVMTSFFDTRMTRMSGTAASATEAVFDQASHATSPEPPRLPESTFGAFNGAAEDAAAQLLRPILQQWLTDNMPKIVEKALKNK